MEGYIVTYTENLTSKEITEINYALFGKVLSKASKKYYYTGLFDTVLHLRLGNGCYFIVTTDKEVISYLKSHIHLLIIKANLEISKTMLHTGRNIKQLKYKNIYVKNL